MNEPFAKSVKNIRAESLGMIKNLRSVKGEAHARAVHSIILADQIDNVTGVFMRSSSQESRQFAENLGRTQMNMVALIMKYLFRSLSLTDQQIEDAFRDAERIQRNTESLINTADELSGEGKVVGE